MTRFFCELNCLPIHAKPFRQLRPEGDQAGPFQRLKPEKNPFHLGEDSDVTQFIGTRALHLCIPSPSKPNMRP
jgi:hypothetical protein